MRSCLFGFLAMSLLGGAEPALTRYTFSEPHMGTRFRIIVYAPDQDTARKAAKDAFARIASLDATMSDYDPTSELMRLCAKAGGPPVPVSAELFFVLSRAQEVSRQSDGAFDVTVGPVVKLWRQARKLRKLPDPEQLAEARALVGWRNVRLDKDKRTVQLLKAGMQLDLGGIAKGYAADEALAVLKKHGLDRALVAAGGDIAVSGPPPGCRRLEDRHRPAARREGSRPARAASRRRVHVRRRRAVRRDRRQTLFAHCRSANGHWTGRPHERDGGRPQGHRSG